MLLTALMARDGLTGMPEAVAAHSPPDVICGAFDARTYRDAGDPGWRAWEAGERAWRWQGASAALKPTTPIEIERYAGPLLLSHGIEDRTWSVEMTRRLERRLRAHGRDPQVHYYEGEDHFPSSAGENLHHEYLIGFFGRHL